MQSNMYLFRMKLLFRDRLTCIILIFSLVIFIAVLKSLSFSAKERSSIPIGLLNKDNSESANLLVESVKQIPSFYVYEEGEASLNKLLKAEQVNAIFVIEEGYEKAIKAGNTKELIKMYYLEDNENVKVLSDIVAGEMLYRICLYKGYNLFKHLPDQNEVTDSKDFTKENSTVKKMTEKEYMDYALGLTKSQDFDFSFDIKMVNINTMSTNNNLDNSVLYLQIVWGILGMILGFLAMLMSTGIILDKEMGLDKRIGITLLRQRTIDFSYLAVMLTIFSVFALFSCMVIDSKIQGFGFLKEFSIYILIILFSIVMGLWFILMGKLMNRVGKYEVAGSLTILLSGFVGYLYLAEGVVANNILNLSKIMPNSWFIQGFTDIILNESLQDIPFSAHIKLAFTALSLLIMNETLVRRQKRQWLEEKL